MIISTYFQCVIVALLYINCKGSLCAWSHPFCPKRLILSKLSWPLMRINIHGEFPSGFLFLSALPSGLPARLWLPGSQWCFWWCWSSPSQVLFIALNHSSIRIHSPTVKSHEQQSFERQQRSAEISLLLKDWTSIWLWVRLTKKHSKNSDTSVLRLVFNTNERIYVILILMLLSGEIYQSATTWITFFFVQFSVVL